MVFCGEERERARRLQHDTGAVSHAAGFCHAIALAFKRVAVVLTSMAVSYCQVDRQMTSEQQSEGPDAFMLASRCSHLRVES